MSALEVRQVKRPRLSLSCSVCRSRKVRCGREHPECTNCLRMNQKCVYESLVRDELTGRLRQPFASNEGRDLSRLDSHKSPTWSQSNPFTGSGDIRPTQIHSNQGDSKSFESVSSSDLNSSLPREHQVMSDKAHPKVPTWEEAIQEPVDQDVSGPRAIATALSDQRLRSQDHGPIILSPDYLSLRHGGRVRYIGKAFWGFVPGQESLSDDFLDGNRNAQPGLPLPHIAAADLANLLKSLPPKPVCDIFLHDFFIMVWPLTPLVHPITLRTDYDEFWEWCRNSETAMPPAKIVDNPTFVCLLFAIILCGACAAPAATWTLPVLQTLKMETIKTHLKSAYRASLSMCQHLEHPTFNTLISTLLTGPFMDRPSEPMQNLLSLSTIVRIAQTMGLHCESTWSALDQVTREMRRRVWWHIVSLDVQSSISTGLPLCCGKDMQDAVSMINFTRNEEIGNISSTSSPPAESLETGESAAMIYAIGRYETARLESKIVISLQNAQGLKHRDFRELVAATKQLHRRLDSLIAKIPVEGFPARGFIPSSWEKASSLTHPSLYKDDTTRPTVFAAWVRIMLTLLKFEVAILMQKPILQTRVREKPHELRTWISMLHLCTSYLRIYLRLHQVPAFAPYAWSYRTCFGPLQSTYILLTYLFRFQRPTFHEDDVRYCVDEAIKIFTTYYQSTDSDSSLENANSDTSKSHVPVAIQVLADLRRRLDSPTESNEPPPSPVGIVDWRNAGKGGTHSNVADSGPDRDFIASLYELQDWLVRLVEDSECFSL